MSDFNQSLKVVLEHEKGFVDNPNDRGGPTKFGITMSTATAYLGGEPASRSYIETLTPAVAGAIYRKLYWTPLGLDHIVDGVLATVVFDLAVLRGVAALVWAIQRCCKVVNPTLVVDGVMGPGTAIAFQETAARTPRALALDIILYCQKALVELVRRDHETQLQFLEGWVNRTQDLIRMTQGIP